MPKRQRQRAYFAVRSTCTQQNMHARSFEAFGAERNQEMTDSAAHHADCARNL